MPNAAIFWHNTVESIPTSFSVPNASITPTTSEPSNENRSFAIFPTSFSAIIRYWARDPMGVSNAFARFSKTSRERGGPNPNERRAETFERFEKRANFTIAFAVSLNDVAPVAHRSGRTPLRAGGWAISKY